MAGIYLHIPFCKQACYYCDFHFSTNASLLEEMVNALGSEIALQKDYLQGESLRTIYFGGGTPSMISVRSVISLLETIDKYFTIEPGAEITLEANPDDLSIEKLRELAAVGINRLSIGIQSFDDEVLRFLNRAHDSRHAISGYQNAREVGFKNISVDLIYAIPGQDHKQWITNVERILQLKPEHISAYSLTVEPKTVLGNWASKGKLNPVGDDVSAEQYEVLSGLLQNAGYDHYEVSNFALPGFYSRHNTGYWKQEKYVGIGPSAHSFNHESRQFNVSNNHEYIRSLRQGIIPFTKELLTREEKINDFLLTTLRTSWGTDLEWLRREMNFDLLTERRDYVQRLIDNELASVVEDHFVLTAKGRLLADKISSDLFVISES